MKKTIVFIIIGILVVSFLGATLYFTMRGLSVSDKMQEYLDVYRIKAEEYIKSAPEITDRYGETPRITFDDTITYKENAKEGNRFLRAISEAFNPKAPADIDEFTASVSMIEFDVEINDDDYIITFEKNIQGELVVTSLTLELD